LRFKDNLVPISSVSSVSSVFPIVEKYQENCNIIKKERKTLEIEEIEEKQEDKSVL